MGKNSRKGRLLEPALLLNSPGNFGGNLVPLRTLAYIRVFKLNCPQGLDRYSKWRSR